MTKNQPRSEVFCRNVDWNLFKVFQQVARHGGIGAAGRALNRRQPSISVALKKLEAQLGLPLCIRSKKGVILTRFGEQVLALSETMTEAVGAAATVAFHAQESAESVVTLRVISNLHLVAELTTIFDDFHRLDPDTEIKLDVASWRSVLQALQAGDVDLGIGFVSEETSALEKLPVIDQVQQLYCGPRHRLFGKTFDDPASLRAEPFVVTKHDPLVYNNYRERYGLGEQVGGVADNLQERMWLIELGTGIGFLPEPVVDASTFASALWPLLPPPLAPTCTLYFMSRPGGPTDAVARRLWDRARHHLRSTAVRARPHADFSRDALFAATNAANAAS